MTIVKSVLHIIFSSPVSWELALLRFSSLCVCYRHCSSWTQQPSRYTAPLTQPKRSTQIHMLCPLPQKAVDPLLCSQFEIHFTHKAVAIPATLVAGIPRNTQAQDLHVELRNNLLRLNCQKNKSFYLHKLTFSHPTKYHQNCISTFIVLV